jgi:two-component system OmpR family sensor kinase
MNIRLRLTLWYTVILFLILLIFSLAVYVGLTRSLLVTVDNHLQREVGEILGNLTFAGSVNEHETEEKHDDGSDEVEKVRRDAELQLTYTPEEGVFWRILTADGQPLIDQGHFDGASFDPAVLQSGRTQFEYASLASNVPIRLYTAPFIIEEQGAGIIQVAESYRHIQDVQRQLIGLLALGIPFTLLAASIGGWILASSALNPIDRITRAAAQISAQDLHQRLNLKLPNDEVGRLAATFDKMLARLEDAFERQKRFIADASHEIRTPLTILKGDVEVALNRPRRPEEYQETLAMVNDTTDRLTALVEELFLLARADNQQISLQLKSFNLSALLMKEVSHLLPRAVKQGVALNLDTPDELTIEADPAKLSRLFINLIDNGIKYSNPGDTVTVRVVAEAGYARVAVADTGPGIPPEHLPHLFERFYRIDKARSRSITDANGSGAGLGLSIAYWLAQLHGGRIDVESQLGQGSTFTVWLPLTPPAS